METFPQQKNFTRQLRWEDKKHKLQGTTTDETPWGTPYVPQNREKPNSRGHIPMICSQQQTLGDSQRPGTPPQNYFPFGRPGAGAPFRDNYGNVIAKRPPKFNENDLNFYRTPEEQSFQPEAPTGPPQLQTEAAPAALRKREYARALTEQMEDNQRRKQAERQLKLLEGQAEEGRIGRERKQTQQGVQQQLVQNCSTRQPRSPHTPALPKRVHAQMSVEIQKLKDELLSNQLEMKQVLHKMAEETNLAHQQRAATESEVLRIREDLKLREAAKLKEEPPHSIFPFSSINFAGKSLTSDSKFIPLALLTEPSPQSPLRNPATHIVRALPARASEPSPLAGDSANSSIGVDHINRLTEEQLNVVEGDYDEIAQLDLILQKLCEEAPEGPALRARPSQLLSIQEEDEYSYITKQ